MQSNLPACTVAPYSAGACARLQQRNWLGNPRLLRLPSAEPTHPGPVHSNQRHPRCRRAAHYPEAYAAAAEHGKAPPQVEFADVGCGFGGLTVRLAEAYPDKLVLGMELRDKVTGGCWVPGAGCWVGAANMLLSVSFC